jgi:hypothetical protein
MLHPVGIRSCSDHHQVAWFVVVANRVWLQTRIGDRLSGRSKPPSARYVGGLSMDEESDRGYLASSSIALLRINRLDWVCMIMIRSLTEGMWELLVEGSPFCGRHRLLRPSNTGGTNGER